MNKTNTYEQNCRIVTSFINNNDLVVDKGGFLSLYYKQENEYLNAVEIKSIEEVIEAFENTIEGSDKKTRGAIYTPAYIRDYIVRETFHKQVKKADFCLCADLSCGCGAFLYSLANYLVDNTHLTYKYAIRNIYGFDIDEKSTERAKILLSLAALLRGESVNSVDFNLYTIDSLSFDFGRIYEVAINNGFDIVVGNPPYVTSSKIDRKVLNPLRKVDIVVGKSDLYLSFFQLGKQLLNSNGCLGYIMPNTFFKSVNGRGMRSFLSENYANLSIADFGAQQIFHGRLTYTCLVFIDNFLVSDKLSYAKIKADDIRRSENIDYDVIRYSELDDYNGWNLCTRNVFDNIVRIENTGKPLGDIYNIKGGIATLANDVYIISPVKVDELYYYIEHNGNVLKIEKTICRNIINANKPKEASLSNSEKIIYPYVNGKVIDEKGFKLKFPNAYKYLLSKRNILDAREKGQCKVKVWYEYGRSQAITNFGKKLLIPTIMSKPHFIYSSDENALIYNGYAIYHEDENELLFLKKLLESEIFWYYIVYTSKPYANGYYSLAKNYIKGFGVYLFSDEEKNYLACNKNRVSLNKYIEEKYGKLLDN